MNGNELMDFALRKRPCVYVLASERNGTLYIGVTSSLPQRMDQHSKGLIDGFAKKHGTKLLVCYEMHTTMAEAIARETRHISRQHWNRGVVEVGPFRVELLDGR